MLSCIIIPFSLVAIVIYCVGAISVDEKDKSEEKDYREFLQRFRYGYYSTRGFQDIEWLMFVMMAVPAMDSLISIVNAIRAEISQRVSTYMEKQNIKKTTTLTVQIKIPGFSYEKIQEIVVDPNECK